MKTFHRILRAEQHLKTIATWGDVAVLTGIAAIL